MNRIVLTINRTQILHEFEYQPCRDRSKRRVWSGRAGAGKGTHTHTHTRNVPSLGFNVLRRGQPEFYFGWHDEDSITDGGRLSNGSIAWAKQAIPNSPCRQKKWIFWLGFWEESLREICWGSHLISPFLASSRNWAPALLSVRSIKFLKNTILTSTTIRFYCTMNNFQSAKMSPPILASCDFSVDTLRPAALRLHFKWGWKLNEKVPTLIFDLYLINRIVQINAKCT